MTIQLSDHFTFKKLIRFVLPSIFMMILSSIYGVVDGLFVSNFAGKTPFAAINLIMPFTMIIGGMGYMFGTGGTALVSKIMGENDKEKANRTFTMVIIYAVMLGVVLTAISMAIVRPVAYLFGATEDMIEYCVLYGRIVIGFSTFYILQNAFQSFLAGAEKPKLGLIVTLVAGCVNIVLDAVFIVGFKWGIVGAAVATGIGQVCGGLIPLIYFARPNSSLLKLCKTKLEFRPLIKTCTNGSSELLSNVSASIVSILYNLQLMKYLGENGVSAYGVVMYVEFIFVAIVLGYTIGSAPIVAYNYGAENHTELKNIYKKSMIFISIAGVLLLGLAQALAIPFAKLFVGYDDELYNLTVHAFRIFSIAYIFMGMNIYASGFFTALNNGLVSAILSFLRALVFQIVFVLVLPIFFKVEGIWWSMPVAEVSAVIVSIIFFIAMKKKYRYA